MERRIKIKGTSDTDIIYALAYLAGFRRGTYIGRTNNIWHRELSSEAMVCFNKETLEKAGGDLAEAMACLGPDIIVSQIYRPPKEDEGDWQPTDEYLIDFNERMINESLVEKIQEEIRSAYLKG